MVEIASAISKNANIVVMDEPTASLTRHEVESLFEIIENLIQENRTVIYVSHRMEETFRIGDRVTVFKVIVRTYGLNFNKGTAMFSLNFCLIIFILSSDKKLDKSFSELILKC